MVLHRKFSKLSASSRRRNKASAGCRNTRRRLLLEQMEDRRVFALLDLATLATMDLPTNVYAADMALTSGYQLSGEGEGEDSSDTASRSTIMLGQSVYETIGVAGDIDEFVFSLDAPKRIYIDALSDFGNVLHTLQGPTGTVVNDQYLQSESVLNLIAGDYRLSFRSLNDSTGAYSFRLMDLAAAPALVPGTPVSGSLNPASEADMFKLPASAGDRFTFTPTSADPKNAGWRLLDPLGRTVLDNFLVTNAADQTLTMTGDYTLMVYGSATDTGVVDYGLNVAFLGNTPPPAFSGTAYTIGDVRTSSIASVGDIARLKFTLSSPTDLYLDVINADSGIYWSLEGPSGVVLSNHFLQFGEILLPNMLAGDYQIVISGGGGATGAYSFRLLDLASATTLTPGNVVTDTLVRTGRESDAYRFTANAGDKFYFDTLTAIPRNAGWRLVDPVGRDVFNSSLGSDVDTVTMPLTGTYNLLIDGYLFESNTVSYSFNVRPVNDAPTQPLILGSTVSSTIEAPGESDRYSFTLDTDSRLYFDAFSNRTDITWSLAGPTGVLFSSRPLASDSVYNEPSLELVAGAYQLTIDGNGTTTGAYSFRMLDLATAAILTPGQLVNGTLENLGRETHAYRFTASAGDKFFLDSQTPDAQSSYWRLIDPHGQALSNAYLGSDVDTLTMPITGTYVLIIEGDNNFNTSNVSYSFNVQSVVDAAPQALVLGSTVASSIATPGQSDRYAFTLAAPSRLYFDALTTSNGIYWTLTGPAGVAVSNHPFANDSIYNSSAPSLNLIAGDYELTIDGVGETTGGYSFRLLDLAASPALVPGTPVIGSLNPAPEADLFKLTVSAGDRFTFTTASPDPMNAYWALLDPLGRIVLDNYIGDTVTTEPLAMSGDYTLIFYGNTSDTGIVDYSLNVAFLGNTPPTAFTSTVYSLGATRSGNLATATQVLRYQFTLSSPTDLYLDSLSSASGITWSLQGPSGVVLSDHSLESGDILLPNMLAGSYEISVKGAVGGFQFRLLDLASATILTPGTTVTDSLLVGGREADAYKFNATAGDKFYFDTTTGTPRDAYWRLVDPLGRDVFYTGLGRDVDTLAMPLTGTYELLIEGYFGQVSSVNYTFNVRPVSDAPAVPLTLGATVSSTIGTPGETDRYTFTLNSATRLYFDALSGGTDLTWTLKGPAGIELYGGSVQTDSAYYPPSSKLLAGDYELTIDGVGVSTGAYTFRMLDLASAAVLVPNQTVSGTLGSAGAETHAYQFTASAGERFYFDSQTLLPQNTYWRLVDPIGRQVFYNTLGQDVAPPIVPLTGSYILLIEGDFSNTSSVPYSFNVQQVDSNPAETTLSPFSIPENEPADTLLGLFGTTDVGPSSVLTYTLVAGVGDSDNASFNIVGNELQPTASFDFEAKNLYSVRVRTADSIGLMFEKVFTINVTDVNERPTDIDLLGGSLEENAGVNPIIGALSGVDPDAGDTLTFTLPPGLGDNGLFNISGTSLRANDSFDFESLSSYSVTVRATDVGGLTFDRSFTINVIDVNEVPSDLLLSESTIVENVAPNSVIGTLSTLDQDANNTFTYALADGFGDNADFTITDEQLTINLSPDFETKSSYNVRIRTTDQDGLFLEKDIVISVLDTGLLNAQVDALGNLTVSDVDIAGKNNQLSVSISGSNLVIADAKEEFLAAPNGWTLSADSRSLSRPMADFTGSITINAAGGADHLAVDYTAGLFANPIVYDGGADANTVTISGGTFESIMADYLAVGQAELQLSGAGFLSLEEVDSIVVGVDAVDDLAFNLATSATTTAILADDGTSGNGRLRLTGVSVATDFQGPTESLMLRSGTTADQLQVSSLQDLTASLAIGDSTSAFATITFGGAIALGGNASVSAFANQSILLTVGSSIQTADGDVTLTANPAAAAGNFVGVSLQTASIEATGLGSITILGTGGNDETGAQMGVLLYDGSTVVSNDGSITMTGTGGASSGNANIGVSISGSGTKVGSVNNAVTVTGVAGGTGASTLNHGVRLNAGGTINSGGEVIVSGRGGSSVTSGSNFGVTVFGAGSLVTSNSGTVSVQGFGGGASGPGGTNHGVRLTTGGAITSTGSSTLVSVLGVGGASQGDNNTGVVVVHAGSLIASASGYVVVNGTGGGVGASQTNYGVWLNGGAISAQGSNPVSVSATAGNAAGTGSANYGLVVSAGSQVAAASGTITVTSTGTANSEALRLANGGSILTSDSGTIVLETDSLNILGSTLGSVSAPSGAITIIPRTVGLPIRLGGSDVLSGPLTTLGLSVPEMNRMFASNLNIGDSKSGSISVASSITRAAATNIALDSGADIGLANSISTAGGSLTLGGNSAASIRPTAVGNDVIATTTLDGTLVIDVNNGVVDSGYSQLRVAGAVNLNDAVLQIGGSSPVVTGRETLTIVSASSITGTFASLPEGNIVNVHGYIFRIRYSATAVTLVGSSRQFDFDAIRGVNTASGYTSVLATDLYTPQQGYGWNAVVTPLSRTTAAGSPVVDLFRDKHISAAPLRTFQVSAEPGSTYNVLVYLGDLTARSVEISVDGGATFQRIDTGINEYKTQAFTNVAAISDHLSIVVKRVDGLRWAIAGIEVVEVASVPSLMPRTFTLESFGGTESVQFSVLDVNRDGRVSPLDALLVINALRNSRNAGSNLTEEHLVRVDVDGSGQLSPIDALLVINSLRRSSSAGEGESSRDSHDAYFLDLDADYWEKATGKRKRV